MHVDNDIPYLGEAVGDLFTKLDSIALGSGDEYEGFLQSQGGHLDGYVELPDEIRHFIDIIVYRRLEVLALGSITGRR